MQKFGTVLKKRPWRCICKKELIKTLFLTIKLFNCFYLINGFGHRKLYWCDYMDKLRVKTKECNAEEMVKNLLKTREERSKYLLKKIFYISISV